MQQLQISQNQQLQTAIKQLSKDSIENVKCSLSPRGISINEKAISNLFQDSKPVAIEKEWFCGQYFLFVTKSVFGITPETLDVFTVEDIFMTITERYPQLTVNDIQLAFRTHTQEEKVYTLSRDIFLKPIVEFIRKKNIVQQEIEKEAEKVRKEQESIQLEIEYRNHAKAVYLESLRQGKWIGNEFEASAIGKNFSVVISDEDRAIWNPRAKEQERANIIKNEDNPMYVNIPWQKLFAQIAMQELIKRGQKFIEI